MRHSNQDEREREETAHRVGSDEDIPSEAEAYFEMERALRDER